MAYYRVVWEIYIEAHSKRHAAKIARQIQLDPASYATFFDVKNKETGKSELLNIGRDYKG